MNIKVKGKTMKRVVSIILSTLIVITMLFSVGCGKQETPEETATAGTYNEDGGDYWETLKENYGGKYDGETVSILTTRQLNIAPEESSTEAIEQSMFLRDGILKEEFGFEAKYELIGDYQLSGEIQRLNLAGDGVYDLVIAVPALSSQMILNQLLLDLNDVSGLDITNKWWNQSVNETTNFNGSVYMAMGPVSPYYYINAQLVFFNKNMQNDFFPSENIYDVVRDGKWTLDKMVTMAKSIGEDGIIDNDSNWEYDENDTYGLTIEYPSTYALTVSCGVQLANKTNDGYVIDLTSSKATDVIQKLTTLFSNSVNMPASETFKTQTDSLPAIATMFANSQSMMTITTISHYSDFKTMTDIYGVLPLPKYDENQNEYITSAHVWASYGVTIPSDAKDPEKSGCFMEAAGYYGLHTLKSVVYDTVLKYRVMDAPDDVDMLDNYIYSNLYFDLNLLYDIGTSRTMLQNIIVGKEVRGLSSAMKSIQSKIDEELVNFNNIG